MTKQYLSWAHSEKIRWNHRLSYGLSYYDDCSFWLETCLLKPEVLSDQPTLSVWKPRDLPMWLGSHSESQDSDLLKVIPHSQNNCWAVDCSPSEILWKPQKWSTWALQVKKKEVKSNNWVKQNPLICTPWYIFMEIRTRRKLEETEIELNIHTRQIILNYFDY